MTKRRAVWVGSEDQLARWDRFARCHPLGTIYHLSSWGVVLRRSFPHIEGAILAIIDGDSDEIVGGLPVYAVKSWLLGNRIVCVPFATFCDPLISSGEDFDSLFEVIERFAAGIGAKYIQIRTYQTAALIGSADLTRSSPYKHHYLSLKPNPNEVRKGFSKTLAYDIKQAEKRNFTIVCGENESHLEVFHRILTATRKRLALPPIPFCFFKNLWDAYFPSHMDVLLAYSGAIPAAGMLNLKFNDMYSVEFAGDVAEFRTKNTNKLLYWEAIKRASRNHFQILGMTRTSADNAGLIAFKRAWGTTEIDLSYFTHPKSSDAATSRGATSILYKAARKVISVCPSASYKALGNFCYRHLG